MIKTPKCKITVIKRSVNKDIIDTYLTEDMRNYTPCSKLKEGEEFIVYSEFDMPDNFCHWAWADIRHDILAGANGARYTWYKEEAMTISGCTDWIKPVLFKIEKIDTDPS